MRTFLMVLLGIVSIAVIISILFQSSNSSGLSGSIAGGAEQLFGKKKAKGYESLLNKITIVGSIVFVILSIVLTVLG